MKRALFVAGDREVTREPVAALLGLGAQPAPLPRGIAEIGWEAARAHSLLEARTLIEFSPAPFDLLAVAPKLPDGFGFELISDFQQTGQPFIPVLAMTQRGRDQHIRRLAALRHHVAGFVDLPSPSEHLRKQFTEVNKPRRVLFVTSNDPSDHRLIEELKPAHYHLEIAENLREATAQMVRFSPHIVVLSLLLPQGLQLCATLKRAPHPPSVLLVGPVSMLANTEDKNNRLRADDYLATPCATPMLTQRVAALVGWGPQPRSVSASRVPSSPSIFHSPTVDDTQEAANALTTLAATPQQASAVPILSARRAGRRVPCSAKVIIESEDEISPIVTYALDLSSGGLFVNGNQPLPLEARIRLRFSLFADNPPIQIEARVVWLTEGVAAPYGIGMEFDQPTSDTLPTGFSQIIEYVNRVSAILYQPD
ncbi:MAG: PilZ domain-containing protein [Myxococcales bacterium]|nr:PilZ domain-containing protein [Myxococcales bacterium]